MKHALLFVDDEENILHSLERSFHNSEYICHFADSGSKGLEILKNNTISVIISDMKMPEMNGIEFLRKAKEYSPESIKIILSAYADINDMMKAINEGHVFSYMTKPWEEERLHLLISNSCAYYGKTQREKELLQELSEKNLLLETINKDLEKKVEKRTMELKLQNSLLTMLLEGFPVTDILNKAVSFIEQQLPGKKAGIWIIEKKIMIGPDITVPKKIIERALDTKQPVFINNIYCKPLIHKEIDSGLLFVAPMLKNELNLLKNIESLIPIIEVLLLQDYYLSDSGKIMGSIDHVLGELDNG